MFTVQAFCEKNLVEDVQKIQQHLGNKEFPGVIASHLAIDAMERLVLQQTGLTGLQFVVYYNNLIAATQQGEP